jgi:hypothetical protein
VTISESAETSRTGALCCVLWENAWEEFTPFLRFDTEIRRIVCTTNAIESVNARIRRAVKARGHFPNEQAALKRVYMAIMSLDPTGKGHACWTMRWKTALNAGPDPGRPTRQWQRRRPGRAFCCGRSRNSALSTIL